MKLATPVARPLGFSLLLMASVLTASCGGGAGTGPAAPALTLTPGDGRIVATWPADAALKYSVYYVGGSSVTSTNYSKNTVGYGVLPNAVSPTVISSFNTCYAGSSTSCSASQGFVNGTQYAATINARQGSSAAGPDAPSQAVTPRLAGEFWARGSDTSWQAGGLNGKAAGESYNGIAVGPVDATLKTSSYVAVGNSGALQVSLDDGATWSSKAGGGVNNLLAVANDSTAFVAVGAGGTVIRSIDNGATWSAPANKTAIASSANLLALAVSSYGFVAVADNGKIFVSSDHGDTWADAGGLGTSALVQVKCVLLACVATESTGATYYSANGGFKTSNGSTTASSWVLAGNNVPLNSNTTVAGLSFGYVSGSSTLIALAVGSDGKPSQGSLNSSGAWTWTAVANPVFKDASNSTVSGVAARALAYGTQFMMVGASGQIFYSPDAVTWTQPAGTALTTSNLNAILHTGLQSYRHYGYIAVGDSGTQLIAD